MEPEKEPGISTVEISIRCRSTSTDSAVPRVVRDLPPVFIYRDPAVWEWTDRLLLHSPTGPSHPTSPRWWLNLPCADRERWARGRLRVHMWWPETVLVVSSGDNLGTDQRTRKSVDRDPFWPWLDDGWKHQNIRKSGVFRVCCCRSFRTSFEIVDRGTFWILESSTESFVNFEQWKFGHSIVIQVGI